MTQQTTQQPSASTRRRPKPNRALARAARGRAATENIPYTRAREIELAIHARMADTGEDYAEAEEIVTDPANQVLCKACGWTVGMVCPECPGCGCYNHQCSGWRHREYMHPDERAELEAAEAECPECGGDTRTGYDCHCDDLADLDDAAASRPSGPSAEDDYEDDYEPDDYEPEPDYELESAYDHDPDHDEAEDGRE